jgi:hypothetical protein
MAPEGRGARPPGRVGQPGGASQGVPWPPGAFPPSRPGENARDRASRTPPVRLGLLQETPPPLYRNGLMSLADTPRTVHQGSK